MRLVRQTLSELLGESGALRVPSDEIDIIGQIQLGACK